jgi:hypothetical protein
MESQYQRDITQQYFRPLKSFLYNPSLHWSTANNKQLKLAEKLSKEYPIPEGNILRLIIYADVAWSYATDSEIQVYLSDMTEIAEFEKEPEPIEKIVFRGSAKSFEITNPYLIDQLYYSMIDLLNFQKIIKEKGAKKKRPSAKIIHLIATEIYNELTQVEQITGSKPFYIAGYIFGLYNIGIKKDDYVMNEEQHEIDRQQKKIKGITTHSYRQYLRDKMKNII